jgi:hypothetical protein
VDDVETANWKDLTSMNITVQSEKANAAETKQWSGLKNRVDPYGDFHSTPERGSWLGNRGILHNEEKQIIKQWDNLAWKTCLLKYGEDTRKGETGRDKLFTQGNYSEIFFLDEATAFTAGHRPCSMCRNKRYKEFKSAWAKANIHLLKLTSENLPYQEMDKELQKDRVDAGGKKKYDSSFELLPPGTMIELGGDACLIWRDRLFVWSFAGYKPYERKFDPTKKVKVLTPSSIVRIYANGFVPQVHVSAFF